MIESSLNNKKVLVTGATGFIGEHLCNTLQLQGALVSAVSRRSQESSSSITWYAGNLRDKEDVKKIIAASKPEIIFHLASAVTGARTLDFVEPTLYDNLISTVNILSIATEVGTKRIVTVGSLEEPNADDATAIPASPYAAAKWASSAYSRMFHALYKTPVVIARLFMVYGPNQKDDKKIIPYVIKSLLNGDSPKLSSGLREIDWIYVEDIVEGLIACAVKQGIEGETVELGSGILVTIRSVIEELAKQLHSAGKPLFGALPDRPMEQIRTARVEKTFKQIQWKPRFSIEEGLKKTIEWYKKHSS